MAGPAAEQGSSTDHELQARTADLERQLADTRQTLDLLRSLPQKGSHPVMVPEGPAAFFEGQLNATATCKVHLGGGKHAEMSAQAAAQHLERRFKEQAAELASCKRQHLPCQGVEHGADTLAAQGGSSAATKLAPASPVSLPAEHAQQPLGPATMTDEDEQRVYAVLERAEAIAEVTGVDLDAAVRQAREELHVPAKMPSRPSMAAASEPAVDLGIGSQSMPIAAATSEGTAPTREAAVARGSGKRGGKKPASGLRRGFFGASPAHKQVVAPKPAATEDRRSGNDHEEQSKSQVQDAPFVGGVVERTGVTHAPPHAQTATALSAAFSHADVSLAASTSNHKAPRGLRESNNTEPAPSKSMSRFKARRAQMHA